ncbi:hypothetical protein CFP56_024479 [Quercus suber]|uniref:Uncharacterized protein n=2 Tax=Quercus suber TaxID=58331 RepID=A0AAW0LX51_QUESU
MKRKKWSELEEQTLLTKYSELRNSGALAKLKTREKKFKPVADHVNTIHHLQDPATYPFKWSWRDVSIKVQNMRHQYLGVKQKIRLSNDEFNWKDGENHWVNFFKYKEVFGDVELDVKSKRLCENNDNDIHVFGDCGDLGFGIDCEDDEDGEEEDEDEEDEDEDVDEDDDEEEDEEENEENLRTEKVSVLSTGTVVTQIEVLNLLLFSLKFLTHTPLLTDRLKPQRDSEESKMKRKKWSELEEQTLLTKYSELRNSGALAKLKTREKKFKPVADHVNTIHHLQDPATYPFKWSWRDVSIKVQNMRHQYLGVKQKIRLSNDEFNWKDGENHWVNFFKYKEVFGDVELDVKSKRLCENNDNDIHVFGDCGDLGFGIDCEDDEDGEEEDEDEEDEDEDEDVDEDDDEEEDEEENEENLRSEGEFEGERQNGEVGFAGVKKLKMGLGGNERLRLMSSKVLDLRDVMVKKRRGKERGVSGREGGGSEGGK